MYVVSDIGQTIEMDEMILTIVHNPGNIFCPLVGEIAEEHVYSVLPKIVENLCHASQKRQFSSDIARWFVFEIAIDGIASRQVRGHALIKSPEIDATANEDDITLVLMA